MASSVATPLERSFRPHRRCDGDDFHQPAQRTSITLQLDLDRNVDAAARDVQAAINAAAGQLADEPTESPHVSEGKSCRFSDHASFADLEHDPANHLYDIADSILVQKISQVAGVGQVNIGGGAKPGVRVELKPAALAHYRIGLAQVRTALQAANANSPKGSIEDLRNRWTISSTDQLLTADKYSPLIVAYSNGAPVRLSDIATVSEGFEDMSATIGFFNGEPGVGLIIFSPARGKHYRDGRQDQGAASRVARLDTGKH